MAQIKTCLVCRTFKLLYSFINNTLVSCSFLLTARKLLFERVNGYYIKHNSLLNDSELFWRATVREWVCDVTWACQFHLIPTPARIPSLFIVYYKQICFYFDHFWYLFLHACTIKKKTNKKKNIKTQCCYYCPDYYHSLLVPLIKKEGKKNKWSFLHFENGKFYPVAR